uniref:Adhesion G protein-coupled receptor G3 n=1 Tax=Ficedula albicollis TaxID=59894 RepID=A0A803V665_FICAL
MCDLVPHSHPEALQALDVPGDHVWVMVGRESAGSHSQLCPHSCWVLGMRFFPSALGAPADAAEQTHLEKAEFVPGARLVGSEQRCDLAAATSHCSLLQGPSRLNTTEKGNAGKIHLPKEIFRSLSNKTVPVVVTVLNIQQLGMFKVQAGIASILHAATSTCHPPAQLLQRFPSTGKQTDSSGAGQHRGGHHSGREQHLGAAGACAAHLHPQGAAPSESALPPSLSPPVPILCHRLTLLSPCRASPLNVSSGIPAKVHPAGGRCGAGTAAVQHSQLLPVPVAGQAGGWCSRGCVTQTGDKGTVCSCDHLSFFTLLLNPALDGSTAKALTAVATAGCGVAMAFSIFTMAFCIFIRCRFRFEETVRTNLGLHVNLMGSLFLLNLAFLLNSGLAGRTHPSTCRVLGGFTHYCLLCCFTWTALEGCQLYLLFVKVLGIYIHHYLAKLCLVGWGFPVLVVGIAGAIGSYGEYSIQTMDHQDIANLCWITSKHLLVHYITNCGYFGLIFLFNMAIFGVVTQKSCSLQGTGAVQGNQNPWKVALVAAGLFCLLGATWATVFLTYGISSTAVLYLFTILNSSQGIFIFIWLVVLYYPKTRETTGSLSYIIRHDKTTTASQD